MSRILAAGLLCLLVQAPSAQQAPAPPTTGTGVIAGALVSADRGGPIRKATVHLVSTTPRSTRSATTDENGRFVFEKLPPAEYTLSAGKPGFLDIVYGARQAGAAVTGRPIALAAGQKIDNISFALPRGGVIHGTIVDEFGDPAYRTTVRAMRFSYANGERILTPAPITGVTDDRGYYRIAGLLPGEYLVAAVPPDTVVSVAAAGDAQRQRQVEALAVMRASGTNAARIADMERMMSEAPPPAAPNPSGYVPVYYSGAPQPALAGTVRVRIGEEVSGIDARLQVLQTGTVTGTITSAELLPSEVIAMLIDPAMPVAQVGVWFRTVDRTGRFTFYGVVPGTYVLRARAGMAPTAPGGAGEMTASREISVTAGPALEQSLRLERGVPVSGKLALDTLGAGVDLTRLRVELLPITTTADWEMPVWREAVDAEGRFTAKGVVPGRFRVRVNGLPAGWSLDAAEFGGKNAADTHLIVEQGGTYSGTLTFTDRTADMSGVVTNAMGSPVGDHAVIVFSADRAHWLPHSRRTQVARPTPDGRYVVRGLPPGAYRVAAVPDPEDGAWFDREFLARLVATSVAVTLAEAERKTQDLRIR